MRPELKTTSDSDLESVFSTEEPKTSGKSPTTEKYVCKQCGQKFRRMVHLDRHEYKHTGVRKYACSYEDCTKTYTNITHLKRHTSVFHEKVEKTKDVKCRFDFCDKMFGSVYSMGRHIREVHENPKIYKCTHCDEKFTQKLKLRRHEVKHTGVFPYNCLKCSKGFVQNYFLERHICKSYKCDQCQTTFEKWSKLMAHRKASGHKTTLHKCEECGKEYVSKFHLTEHIGTHDEDKEVFECPHDDCMKFYSYKKNLTQHIRTVHEDKRFPCTVVGCELKLSCKKSLENHVKVMHSEKKKRPKLAKKQRAKRKDAGKRKQSTLSKLSGVVIEKTLDKMIMEGTAEIEIDLPAIHKEIQSATTEADDGDGAGQNLVLLEANECS